MRPRPGGHWLQNAGCSSYQGLPSFPFGRARSPPRPTDPNQDAFPHLIFTDFPNVSLPPAPLPSFVYGLSLSLNCVRLMRQLSQLMLSYKHVCIFQSTWSNQSKERVRREGDGELGVRKTNKERMFKKNLTQTSARMCLFKNI